MPELRTLLHDAAPLPANPLDMRAVRARAGRRRRSRRILTWMGALLTLAFGAFAGPSLLVSPVSPTEVDGVRLEPVVSIPTPETTSSAAPQVTSSTQGDVDVQAPRRAQVEPIPTPLPSTTSAPSTSISEEPYPSASDCSVDDGGLAAGQSRMCRFRSTGRGGAALLGDRTVVPAGEVRVTRDGETTTYQLGNMQVFAGDVGVGATTCLDDVIEPGDRVEVVLTSNADSATSETVTLAAGVGWGC